MTNTITDLSLRKSARFAGVLYLIWVITGLYGLLYVPSHTFVQGDVGATANKLLANEFIFRTGLVNVLISSVIWVFLVLILYRLFKQVNEWQAKLLVALVIVQIPVSFITEAFNITSLMIFKGEILKSFELSHRQDMALLFFKISDFSTITVIMFWGLWLLPFGYLVYKSGFIPRIFGLCLFIGGIGWIIDSVMILLFPTYSPFISQYVLITGTIGEIPIMLWLLIKGVIVQPTA